MPGAITWDSAMGFGVSVDHAHGQHLAPPRIQRTELARVHDGNGDDKVCCVSRWAGAALRGRARRGSDCEREFVDGGGYAQERMAGFDAEFVVAASEVLDERVFVDHD